MPHIRIRALSEKQVQNLSLELPQELAKIIQTSVDHFTVERVATQFYNNGRPSEGDPMIEVLWFDRGSELKSICAKKITELVQNHSTAEHIAVVFTDLPKENYFENGEHF